MVAYETALSSKLDYPELITAYQEIVEKENDVNGLRKLGDIFVALKRYEEAINYYDKVLTLQKKNPEIWMLRGNAYLNLKRYEQSFNDFNQALTINKKHHPSLYNLACYYALQGDVENSVYFLQKAIKVNRRWKNVAKNEKDFDAIKNEPLFKQLID